MSANEAILSGSVPRLYQRYLVPLIFEPYAADLAGRVASRSVSRVLEIAAGTGVVTRRLSSTLPDRVAVTATDLHQGMLDVAMDLGTTRAVEWRQADAMSLPFGDGSFDAVVCQFGVMFFPDKPKAFAEARRVLRPGGALIFNVWDRLEENEFADIVTASVGALFPDDPPRFLARTPYGYHDHSTIEREILTGGWVRPPLIETVAARSRAASPRDPAIGFCQGTPLRDEIVARDPSRLAEATAVAAEAIARRFGRGAVDGRIQALVVTVES